MNIRKIVAGAGVAAISLGAVLPAAALTAGTDSDANLTGAVGVTSAGSGASGTGAAGTNVNANVNAGVTGSTNGSGTASSSTNAADGINVAAGDINGDGRAETNVSGSSDIVLTITRADIDSNAVDSASWGSRSAGDVRSNADLKAYVASQMKSDTNLSSVSSNSSDVAVTYKQRGRFLGFIPVSINATAVVDQNGQVRVEYPWYAVLMVTDRANLQAKLQASVDAMVNTSASTSGTAGNSTTTPNANAVAHANANASFQLTADTQARIVSEMRRIMGEELTASANASANANTSGSTQ